MKITGKILIWIVCQLIDPAILWCYGWKYEYKFCIGKKFECWIDPVDGQRYARERAIEKCESRI